MPPVRDGGMEIIMKTIKIIALILSFVFVFVACGSKKEMETETKKDLKTEKIGKTDSTEEQSVTPQNIDSTSEDDFSYKDMKNLEFSFSSGAGAWSTELYIEEDGKFHGIYHDTNAGETGEDYPNGTQYVSEFKGEFSNLIKVDNLTYKTTIKSITYNNKVGTQTIKDGVLYKYSEAYGLDNPKDMIFYLPDTRVSDLPEEFYTWIAGALYDYETNTEESELSFIGLYNENAKEGFSSYSIVESFEQRYKDVLEEDKKFTSALNKDLTQYELNSKAKELYDLWDNTLNDLWNVLQIKLSENEMNALITKEKEWIHEKEKRLKKIEKEYDGGSMMPMMIYTEGATITEERVEELRKYLY